MKHAPFAAAALAALLGTSAAARTAWDLSTPWPASNFQAVAAQDFADAVRAATDGEVDITVHMGGEIGVAGSESLAAVETGIVQAADYLLFLQAGEEPLLAMDTLPYLVQGQEEMRLFLKAAGPAFEEIAARHNQKILYYVPWPSPGVYSRSAISTAAEMSGQRIRAFNPASFAFLGKLGAAPLEMPWGDVAPALAAGTIDGVATSTSSGVDGKLWEFTSHFNPLNWSTSTDVVTVNLDAWNALTEEQRSTIEALAAKMQPEFWALSAAEDEGKTEILQQNGITVSEADDSLKALMASGGREMWAAFVARVPEAGPIIDAYAAEAGK
ncbi:TRAP transporter substrate-binding protein (plasmid) [Paroceanicella profunda]|uniref:TRAP transporter substrate-binding protein n=1 Tax=Paroceanicella profunda TaxID=2579971 RepID=A0A5B8G6Y3_9RHOB|nr:TRAP transporter substrate-binding protein [Paroceanicella profunda]QDL94923.1 TRAP transporter substrate-binding protein [Paroceanicella profunda]